MTVTEPASESVAPSGGPVVKVTDAWKLHKLGDEIVRALVNVSLNGPKLFGDESYNEALQTIAAGCATGIFKVTNREAALDVALGGVLVAAMTILQAPTKPDHPEATTELILRALGVPGSQAQRIVSLPLPELAPFAGPHA